MLRFAVIFTVNLNYRDNCFGMYLQPILLNICCITYSFVDIKFKISVIFTLILFSKLLRLYFKN